jgi:predicted transcriptional regulator
MVIDTILTATIKSALVATTGKGSSDGTRLNLSLLGTARVFELLATSRNECNEWHSHLAQLIKERLERMAKEKAEARERAEATRIAKLEKIKRDADEEKRKFEDTLRRSHEAEMKAMQDDMLRKERERLVNSCHDIVSSTDT